MFTASEETGVNAAGNLEGRDRKPPETQKNQGNGNLTDTNKKRLLKEIKKKNLWGPNVFVVLIVREKKNLWL